MTAPPYAGGVGRWQRKALTEGSAPNPSTIESSFDGPPPHRCATGRS